MSLLKIHSRSKPFGRKPFFVFSLVYRCALCVMMTRLIYQPTNSVLEVSANPCPALFTEQIQMHLHAHLSVCLSVFKTKISHRGVGALKFTISVVHCAWKWFSKVTVWDSRLCTKETLFRNVQNPLLPTNSSCIHQTCTASEDLQRRRDRVVGSLTPCDGCCWMVVGVAAYMPPRDGQVSRWLNFDPKKNSSVFTRPHRHHLPYLCHRRSMVMHRRTM